MANESEQSDFVKEVLMHGVEKMREHFLHVRWQNLVERIRRSASNVLSVLAKAGFTPKANPQSDEVSLMELAQAAHVFFRSREIGGVEQAALAQLFEMAVLVSLHPVHGYDSEPISIYESNDRIARIVAIAWNIGAMEGFLHFDRAGHFESVAKSMNADANLKQIRTLPKAKTASSRELAREIHAKHPKWGRTRIAEAVAKATGKNPRTMARTLRSTFDELGVPKRK